MINYLVFLLYKEARGGNGRKEVRLLTPAKARPPTVAAARTPQQGDASTPALPTIRHTHAPASKTSTRMVDPVRLWWLRLVVCYSVLQTSIQ